MDYCPFLDFEIKFFISDNFEKKNSEIHPKWIKIIKAKRKESKEIFVRKGGGGGVTPEHPMQHKF